VATTLGDVRRQHSLLGPATVASQRIRLPSNNDPRRSRLGQANYSRDTKVNKHTMKLTNENYATMYKTFSTGSVCRADLEDLGFDTSHVKDSKMEEFAQKLRDDYHGYLCKSGLESSAVALKIPLHTEVEKTNNRIAKLEQRLLNLHLAGISRKGAEAWNLGWYSAPGERIESKTTKGILVSCINRTSKKVSHRWHRR